MGRVDADEALLRSAHDPARPAVTTAQAAERLRQSRFHVAELVKSGALPGYGIPAEQRTRWYVYVDALDDIARADAPAARVPLRETLREIRNRLGEIERKRLASRRTLVDVYDAVGWPPKAKTVEELVQSVNDSERRNFDIDGELSMIRDLVIELLDHLEDEEPAR